MYDKSVRRRRAVLGLLVAFSLILITAYFGESSAGALHGVQRGASEVMSPVQDGASRTLKPVRDLLGWFGDTVHAKGDVKDLRRERDRYRAEATEAQAQIAENRKLRAMLRLRANLGLDQYGPLTARVNVRSPTVWYATIGLNKGSNDGVKVGQPVMNEQAVIGTVSEVFSGSSQVRLITDSRSAVPALVGTRQLFGVASPASAGNPNDLILKYPDDDGDVESGDRVVTQGSVSRRKDLGSLFPKDLPLGEVTHVDHPGTDTQEVHLRPYANMRKLDTVQILTAPEASG